MEYAGCRGGQKQDVVPYLAGTDEIIGRGNE